MICIPKLALEIQDLSLPVTVLLPRLDNIFNMYITFSGNVLHDANVPPSRISKIMSTLCEDDKGTFVPKTIFNITEISKSLLNMANGIFQSMTKAER